jgi:hypothetical protein
MVATDPLVGGYTWSSFAIYGCLLLNVLIGKTLLRQVTPIRVGTAAFLCSLQFFVLTNPAAWLEGLVRYPTFYQPGFAGLMKAYVDGLPFWGRTLAGDLFFSVALFGMYELLARQAMRAGEHALPDSQESRS